MTGHKIEPRTPEGNAYGSDLMRRTIAECTENNVCPLLMVESLAETLGIIIAAGTHPSDHQAILNRASAYIVAGFNAQISRLAASAPAQVAEPVKAATHAAPARKQ